jgi:hypothetical protein
MRTVPFAKAASTAEVGLAMDSFRCPGDVDAALVLAQTEADGRYQQGPRNERIKVHTVSS